MKDPADKTYGFGPFVLDARRRLLLRDGDPVQLTPKALDLLVALVERRGRVVEKDELLRVVWPDQFVEEANLSVNMSALRKALGERASENQFVATVPRRGYRFVADMILNPQARAIIRSVIGLGRGLGVPVVIVLSLAMERAVFRPLRGQSPAVMLIATFELPMAAATVEASALP
mgnify:CR=1 FL=1